jgi:hypothetical protein
MAQKYYFIIVYLLLFYSPPPFFSNCVKPETAELEMALHWGMSVLDILTCVLKATCVDNGVSKREGPFDVWRMFLNRWGLYVY